MIIHGRCCTFDYSRRVDRANFAGTVVPYFDRMAPKVFAAVGFTLPSQRAEISFSSISGGMFKTPNLFEISDNLRDNDLGRLHFTTDLRSRIEEALTGKVEIREIRPL